MQRVAHLFEIKKMNKPEMLELLKLLSAIESWSFTSQSHFPDYLHEKLQGNVELLSKEILK